jgi:hypothetical protein
VISFLFPIEKPYEIWQERILCEGSYKVCECSGGVVATSSLDRAAQSGQA